MKSLSGGGKCKNTNTNFKGLFLFLADHSTLNIKAQCLWKAQTKHYWTKGCRPVTRPAQPMHVYAMSVPPPKSFLLSKLCRLSKPFMVGYTAMKELIFMAILVKLSYCTVLYVQHVPVVWGNDLFRATSNSWYLLFAHRRAPFTTGVQKIQGKKYLLAKKR